MENREGVDAYLENIAIENRIALSRIRKIIKTMVPEATEVLSYKMPAYKYHGMLVGFAAHKSHCSLYLWKDESINHFKDELNEFSISAGTIRFTPDHPIPDELLIRIINFRKQENLEKYETKKRKGKP